MGYNISPPRIAFPPRFRYNLSLIHIYPLFERDGYDIWCEIPITFAQAAMGDDIIVPTVDGRCV